MKKLCFLFIISILFIAKPALASNSYVPKKDTLFEYLLKKNNMIFDAPKGFKEIKPIPNDQMEYEKAYKHPKSRFEVRYAIRANDLNMPKQMFEVTALNISGGNVPEYSFFPAQAVKDEFGADVGITGMITLEKEFGQDYKYCLLVYIHKNNVGDGYIFYMCDDPNIIPDLMDPIFHALRFKD